MVLSLQIGQSLRTHFPVLLCADLIGAGPWVGQELHGELSYKNVDANPVCPVELLLLRPALYRV